MRRVSTKGRAAFRGKVQQVGKPAPEPGRVVKSEATDAACDRRRRLVEENAEQGYT